MATLQGAPISTAAGGLFSGLEQKFNLPAGYLAQTAQIESGGDPNAVSPTGAKGLFQFTKGTAAQYGLSNPNDVVASSYAAAKLASDNAATLTNALGRPPTAPELYLAHQQGAGGAAALLANPNARAGDIVGDRAVAVNGGDPNMTAGQFASLWLNKFGSPGNIGGMPAGASIPAPPGTLAQGGIGGSPAPIRMAAAGSPYGALVPMTQQSGTLPTFAAGGMANPSGTARNTAFHLGALAGVWTEPLTTITSIAGANLSRILASHATARSMANWAKAYEMSVTKPAQGTRAGLTMTSRAWDPPSPTNSASGCRWSNWRRD